MANVAPAKVTITSTNGPGQAVTSLVLSDVALIEVNFAANTIKLSQNSGKITYFDYSAMATLTWTITAGATAIVVSS